MTKNRSTAISLPKIKTMETNAPKNKFVYPDKLYARTNDNITLDISYAPQTLKAVEYARTDAFIKKAEGWLREVQKGFILTDKDITDFVDYMEGE